MLVLWQTFLRQGWGSAFGPPGPDGLAPEHWPNPLSLSRPTDTLHSHDVMARRLPSLITLVMAEWGLGSARRPCCGSACRCSPAVPGSIVLSLSSSLKALAF